MRSFKISQSITDRQDASLNSYFKDVSRQPMISQEEEIELTKKIKEGNEAAVKKLVEANLRFVISVAKQYQNKGVPLTDLVQEGSLGLIEGAKKYNPDKIFKSDEKKEKIESKVAMTVYKESVFRKFINKIKNIFHVS